MYEYIQVWGVKHPVNTAEEIKKAAIQLYETYTPHAVVWVKSLEEDPDETAWQGRQVLFRPARVSLLYPSSSPRLREASPPSCLYPLLDNPSVSLYLSQDDAQMLRRWAEPRGFLYLMEISGL